MYTDRGDLLKSAVEQRASSNKKADEAMLQPASKKKPQAPSEPKRKKMPRGGTSKKPIEPIEPKPKGRARCEGASVAWEPLSQTDVDEEVGPSAAAELEAEEADPDVDLELSAVFDSYDAAAQQAANASVGCA